MQILNRIAVRHLHMATSVPSHRLDLFNDLVPVAKPFLKWAGGKGQLFEQFMPLYPRTFDGYHEPFVGSAAVYFHLFNLVTAGKLKAALERVRLTDANEELINCYAMVRDDVDVLIRALARHRERHSSSHYYAVRADSPATLSREERAARLIYLNKTCYNGLYRVNRKGEFNVPMGSYKNPSIYEADELRQVSRALQKTEIHAADFREVRRWASAGDFVYFDPPYHPLTTTSSFTNYTDQAFGEQEQRDLAQVYRDLDRRGCKLMLSNSWTPFIIDLYGGFRLVEVKATRAINSNPNKRGKISELVVLNYD